MPAKFFTLFLASALIVSLCIACGSREQEADIMLIKITPLLKEQKFVELKGHLNEIISKYPETEAASTATLMLDDMVKTSNRIAEDALRLAWQCSLTYLRCYPDAELDMEKMEELGLAFGTFENVEIEIVRREADDFLITSKHIVGDRIYSVGNDGQIAYEELPHTG